MRALSTSRISRRTLLGVAALAPTISRSQQELAIDPYAMTGGRRGGRHLGPVPIAEGEINVVSSQTADLSGPLEIKIANYMRLWVAKNGPGRCEFVWDLDVDRAGVFEVRALTRGEQPYRLSARTTDGAIQADVDEKGWQRVVLGRVDLRSGKQVLGLSSDSAGFDLSALELVRPPAWQEIQKKAIEVRSQPDWFQRAGYGLMFQWTNRSTPPRGAVKPWEAKVGDFNLDRFVDLVEGSGAAYVIWSITWGEHYISAPIRALDDILPGRTTKRDLLGEMAERLAERNVKLIFYYHYGYDCYHSQDPDWMSASGAGAADRTRFYENWQAIVGEVGERYGDKLGGWFFDGGQRYYDCHFDNTPNMGLATAPFEDLTRTAKRGNDQRIVSYNPWILPSLTPFEDYFAGEGFRIFDGLSDGKFPDGPYAGLQAHTAFPLEKHWGHIDADSEIESPRYTADRLVKAVRTGRKLQYPYSINLEMYEDGSVSAQSRQLLREVRRAIRS